MYLGERMATHISTALPVKDEQRAIANHHTLFWIAGIAAVSMVLLVMFDTGVSMAAPAEDASPGSLTVVEWFDVLDDDPVRGLRDLGFINILNSILGIPIYLALYVIHERTNRELAGLALVLFLFGSAIYISNNTVLPMLELSDRYAAASTDAEQATIEAAGQAMLARGADFTPGTIVGFVLPSLAGILMAYVLLVDGIFSKITAYSGLIGLSLLLVFTVWVTYWPASFDTAMLIAMPGGLLILVWNSTLAWRFFKMAREDGS